MARYRSLCPGELRARLLTGSAGAAAMRGCQGRAGGPFAPGPTEQTPARSPWAGLSPRSGVVAEEGSSAPGDLGTPPEQEGRSRLISQEEKCAAVILAEQFQVLVGTPQLSLCSVRWI